MESAWKETTFDNAVQINPTIPMFRGKTYPFVDMKTITEGKRNADIAEYRNFNGSGSRFLPYDTLMARITPCLENGKIARFLPESNCSAYESFGSTEFIVIRGKPGVTNNDFVYYLTTWNEFRNFAISQMTGSSGRQRVPVNSLSGFTFYLPPLPVQERIANILGSLDDKIELNRQMNETLEAMARAIFKSWFVDFDPVYAKIEGRDYPLPAEVMDLFPDELEESELGLIPKGWRISTIDEEIEITGGGTPSTKNPEFWEDGIYNFATPKDLSNLTSPILINTERKVTEKGLKKISSALLDEGTLLMSSRAPVGYLAIAEIPVCINQGFIAMKCNKTLSNYFMLNWAFANMDDVKSRASGTTFAEISKSNFRLMKLIVPQHDLVRFFSQKVEPIYIKILNNLIQNKTIGTLRNNLLPKLINGEIEI